MECENNSVTLRVQGLCRPTETAVQHLMKLNNITPKNSSKMKLKGLKLLRQAAILLAAMWALSAPAQVASATQDNGKATQQQAKDSVVQEPPMFPGGLYGLMRYIASRLKYPESAIQQGVEGTVVVEFVVKSDGTIGEARIKRGLTPECDYEALTVVESLPKFTPGRENGKPVNTWYTLPITFKMPIR